MMEAIGKPLEPTDDDFAKIMMLRILANALNTTLFLESKKTYKEIETNLTNVIENEPSLREDFAKIISSDLSPKDKRKAIRKLEREKFEEIRDVIIDLLY